MSGELLVRTAASVKILVISPFHGASSHAAWARGWQAHSRHDIRILSLPDKGWSWRLKGGCVPLAEKLLELDFEPDLVVATSLTCLSSLYGVLRHSSLPRKPTIYFMHENQLTYPIQQGGRRDSQLVLRQFHSQLLADEIWYNSHFNLTQWLEALPTFLGRFPDHQGIESVQGLRAKSKVMHVGLELGRADEFLSEERPPLLLWNQRWEWEKGIDRFCKVVQRLGPTADFEVVLLGESLKRDESQRKELEAFLGSRLLHSGWCERTDYEDWLRRATFTVSVARHEFFGISILEAAGHGVLTLLPDDLAYPELLPNELHEECLYRNLKGLSTKMKQFLDSPDSFQNTRLSLKRAARQFCWPTIAGHYDRECEKFRS